MKAARKIHSGRAPAAADVYASRVLAHPTIVPRCDPVVYSDSGAPGPLTAGQLRTYEQDGFLTFEGLFTPEEIGLLQEELQRLKNPSGDIDPRTLILEPNSHELRSIFRVHAASTLFARLFGDARLVSIANALLGDDVYVHQSRLNYKPGFFGKEFYWHSDFETWHIEDGMPRMRALSMSISLTQNTEFNGPLMLVPGSHRHFVTCVGETPKDHYRQSLRRQEYGVPDPESLAQLVERGGLAAPTGGPGSVTLFDCNVMHGSNSNITPFARTNAFVVYNAVSNRLVAPFGGQPPRPEFIATRETTVPIRPLAPGLI